VVVVEKNWWQIGAEVVGERKKESSMIGLPFYSDQCFTSHTHVTWSGDHFKSHGQYFKSSRNGKIM